MELARIGNKYLADKEPWKMDKETQKKEIGRILLFSINIVVIISIMSYPFLPNTAIKIRKILNVNSKLHWPKMFSFPMVQLLEGHQINPPELLFQKIDDETIEAQTEKLGRK